MDKPLTESSTAAAFRASGLPRAGVLVKFRLTEALAHGLPIVSTRGGAAADTVPDDVALKVPAGDPAALGKALASLLDDEKRRRALAEAAFSHARHLPDWSQTAAVVAAQLKNGRT